MIIAFRPCSDKNEISYIAALFLLVIDFQRKKQDNLPVGALL
jgi:hypothetical protein